MIAPEQITRLLDDIGDIKERTVRIETNQERDAQELGAMKKQVAGHEQLVQRGKGIFWGVQLFWGVIATWIAKQHWGGR